MHQIADPLTMQETCRNRSRQASLYGQVNKGFQTLYVSKELGINVGAKTFIFYYFTTLQRPQRLRQVEGGNFIFHSKHVQQRPQQVVGGVSLQQHWQYLNISIERGL